MEYSTHEIDARLHFLSELLFHDTNCYLWCYSKDGDLLSTNSPKLVLNRLFQRAGCFDYMMEYAKSGTAPLMMSNAAGIVWGAVFEVQNAEVVRVHVLGPVSSHAGNRTYQKYTDWNKVGVSWRSKFIRLMDSMPVISSVRFMQILLMMQFCITGEHLTVSDIVMQQHAASEKDGGNTTASTGEDEHADRTQVYMAEQSLLSYVRNGDPSYNAALSEMTRSFNSKHMLSKDALQHEKLGQVQFIAQCCTAAVEGGLPLDTAYTRKDTYIWDVDNAKSISEVRQIGMTMYNDYVHLVYKQRANRNLSTTVQSTCDFIENHLGENLSTEELARRVGYSNYYLSRLFKKETGFSIDEYARNARVERAKIMLVNSTKSIQQIAEELGFGDRNYFTVTFKKVTGIPPATYRRKNQHL